MNNFNNFEDIFEGNANVAPAPTEAPLYPTVSDEQFDQRVKALFKGEKKKIKKQYKKKYEQKFEKKLEKKLKKSKKKSKDKKKKDKKDKNIIGDLIYQAAKTAINAGIPVFFKNLADKSKKEKE